MSSKFETPYKFIRNAWLDLPEFMKYMRALPLGQQHCFLKYVEQIYNEEWWQTIMYNSTRDINTYRSICKKFNVKTSLPPFDTNVRKTKFSGTSRHRMVAQGLGETIADIKSFKGMAQEASASIQQTTKIVNGMATEAEKFFLKSGAAVNNVYFANDRISQTLGHVDALLQQFNFLVGSLVEKVNSYSVCNMLPTLLTAIAKFMAMGYLLSQQHNQTLPNIIAILLLVVPLNWSGLHSLANDLFRAIQGLVGKFTTQDGDGDTNVIIGFFELIKGIMQSIFKTANDDQFKDMRISSLRIKVISDTIRSATTIFDFISKLVMSLIEVIGDKCLKYFGFLPWFARDRSIEHLINEYEQIKLLRLEDKAQINRYAAKRIIALHDALLSAEAKLQKRFLKGTSEMRSITPYLRLMIKNLSDILAKIPDHFRSGKDPRRVKPFWVYIYGDPRIGKSALFQPYIVNALAKSLKLIDKYEDYTNYTYFRNCGEEYWEGYYGQSVLWYNDLLQNNADEQAMHKAVLELTNVVDDNLFPLNMAFERKHGVYFDSELVISNAQAGLAKAEFIKQKCWSGGSHLLARRNVVLELTINPKYKALNNIGYDQQKVDLEMKNNPDNAFGVKTKLFPKDMYVINIRDNMTENVLYTVNFEQCIAYLQNQAHDFKQNQIMFKDKLYNEFEAMWAESGEDLPTLFHERVKKLVEPQLVNRLLLDKVGLLTESTKQNYLAYIGSYIVKLQHPSIDLHYDKTGMDITCDIWERCGGDIVKFASIVVDAYHATSLVRVIDNDNFVDTTVAPQRRTTMDALLDDDYVRNSIPIDEDSTRGPPVIFDYVKEPPVDEYHDAQEYKQELIDDAMEPVAREIRKLFPDLVKFGWDEAVMNFEQKRVILPHPTKHDDPDSRGVGDALIYKKFFQGFDIDHRTRMRIVLSVEAIGYEMFDNMHYTKTRTFCQMARDTLKRYGDSVRDFMANNVMFRAVTSGVMVGGILMSFIHILDLTNGYLKSKFTKCEHCAGILNAQTAEGNNKPQQRQMKRVIKKSFQTQAYDSQNQVVENKVKNQMCKFSTHVVHNGKIEDARIYGSALCIGADIFIMPDHFYSRWAQLKHLYDEKGDEFRVNLHWDAEKRVELDWDSLQFYKLKYEHADDLCFVRIKNLVQMQQLKKFFHSVNDNPSLFDSYLYGKRAGDYTPSVTSVQRTEMVSQIYEHPERLDTIYGVVLPGRKIQIPLCFRYYDARTINGDCGSLLMSTDTRLNCRKILGMHTAGGVDSAVSSIIYQEDIDEAIAYFSQTCMVVEVQDDLKPITDTLQAQALEDIGLKVAGELSDINVPGYPVKVNPKIMLPRKSKITHSLIHDLMENDYGPTKLSQAKLRPFKNKMGDIVSPLYVGLKKLTKVAPMVPKKYSEKIITHMYQTIKSWHSPYQEPRLLTDYEVVNGFGNLNPIEMKTSPGYPYVLLDNTNGKIPFFTQNEDLTWSMKPLVMAKYNEREQLAQMGVIPPTYFIASLKDETRPIEKVELGKTRIFQISPMDYNMLLRKYFGYFIAHCHATYLNGEMAVGINANSYEWTLMIKRMMEVGNNFVNGDGENFDASTGQHYSMDNVEVINKWYNDGEENFRVRRVLYMTFLNAKNVIGRLVVTLFQGNQSGTYLTTIFNNMTGMYAVRLTYLRCGYDLSDFHLHIRNKDYGDDDLICISDSRPLFNFFTHQSSLAMMGITYTTAQKTNVTKPYFDVTEITFLKRSFIKSGNLYLPQMPMDVILEIPRWSESDPTKMEDQMNRFNSSLLEMSNYPKSEYERLKQHYEEYCFILQKAGFSILPQSLFDFEKCFEIKFYHICGDTLQPSSDLASEKPNSLVLLSLGGSGSVQPGKINEQDSCVLVSYTTTNNQNYEMQTQGEEITPIRSQSNNDNDTILEIEEGLMEDFQCEMFLMEKVREIAPIMQSIYTYAGSQLRRTNIRLAARRLCHSVLLLHRVYVNCVRAFSGTEPMYTQGDEGPITQNREESPAADPAIETIPVGPAEEGQDVVKEKTSIFINDEVPHQPEHLGRQIRRDWISVRDINMEQFFERPYILEEFLWSNGQDGKLLKTYDFPTSIYNVVALKNKLANIAYARPDIEIEIYVNGTTFHYGTLTAAVIPFAGAISNAYKQVHSVTTWPQWYEITAGAAQSIKFTIPYKHFFNTQHIQSNITFINWASLYIYVTAPLTSVSVTLPPAVGVTVIARLIKPQFCGLVTQGEEQLSMQGITTAMGGGRVVSTGLAAVSKVADSASRLTAACGWSVPVNNQATAPMQLRSPLFGKVNDLPTSTVIGPSLTASLDRDFSAVNADYDEMEFKNFINHPSLIDRKSWTASLSSGDMIWEKKIDSTLFQNFQGVATDIIYPTPLGYIVNSHTYWRGSIKLCIRVIASSFHAGRLRVVYTPMHQGLMTINTVTSANARNVTIDINGTSDTILEIPYDTEKPWMVTNTVPSDPAGKISIMVLNPLTSGTTLTPTAAYVKIFCWGGPDFQVSLPCKSFALPDLKWQTVPDASEGVMFTQGEERKVGPCKLPATSADCLKNAPTIWLGDVDRRQKLGNYTTSFPYNSVKQACNMLTPLARYKTSKDNKISCYFVEPLYGSQTSAFDSDEWNCQMMYYRAIYMFARGGFRVAVLTDENLQTTVNLKQTVQDDASTGEVDLTKTNYSWLWDTDDKGTLGNLDTNTYGMAYFTNSAFQPVDVTIPYFSSTPNVLLGCGVTTSGFNFWSQPYGNDQGNAYKNAIYTKAIITMSNQEGEHNVVFFASGADDLMFGYRKGIPVCRTKKKADLITQGESKVYSAPKDTKTYVDVKTSSGLKIYCIQTNEWVVATKGMTVEYFLDLTTKKINGGVLPLEIVNKIIFLNMQTKGLSKRGLYLGSSEEDDEVLDTESETETNASVAIDRSQE